MSQGYSSARDAFWFAKGDIGVSSNAREWFVGSGNVGGEKSECKKHFFTKCRNRTNAQSECARVSESDRERQRARFQQIRGTPVVFVSHCLGIDCHGFALA